MTKLELMILTNETKRSDTVEEMYLEVDRIRDEVRQENPRVVDGEYIARCAMRLAELQLKLRMLDEQAQMLGQLEDETPG